MSGLRARALLALLVLHVPLWHARLAAAEPRPAGDTMLVLDASNSMWGQIDGVNKIVIAKDVVESLLLDLPADRRVGLVAYGHRKKGDCADIETLAGAGAERAALRTQVRALSARGMTPLSAAVKQAAEALGYGERRATVILVSDGVETCDLDPCALARALEAHGADFTIHVVGFDMTPAERATLACLAEETGGTLVAAADAGELAAALARVAAADAPPAAPAAAPPNATAPAAAAPPKSSAPAPSTVVLKATIMDGGPLIQRDLAWTVTPAAGGAPVFSAAKAGVAETTLAPGPYTVTATWTGWRDGAPRSGSRPITVAAADAAVVTLPIPLGLPVTLDAAASAKEGDALDVTWSGPDELGALIDVATPLTSPLDHEFFLDAAHVRASQRVATGQPVTAPLTMPGTPGDYELRYVVRDPPLVLAARPIRVEPYTYALTAPEAAPISSPIQVAFEGPAHAGDRITIAPAGHANPLFAKHYVDVEPGGSPVTLTMPSEPGAYEVRYVLGAQRVLKASRPITATAVGASLDAPAEAEAGSTIAVAWTGPDGAADDWLSVTTPGGRFSRDSFVALKPGTPASLRVPGTPGAYELIYVVNPGREVIARRPLTVTPSHATVSAPASVEAGSAIEVAFSGRGFAGDRVVLVAADTPDDKMWGVTANAGFAATSGATSGTIAARLTQRPGTYELRYVSGQGHRVLARQAIVVVP